MRLAVALFLFAIFQAPARVAPEPRHFQFERGIAIHPGATGKVCAALDASVYEHSSALTDVRLYAGSQEVPYALLASQVAPNGDSARVLNLGERNGHLVFDLEMPSRPYSTVNLNLTGQNFLAIAKVTGRPGLGDKACCSAETSVGTFTLFDLSAQHLGRSTALNLAESTFPYLHVELAASAAAGHPGFVPSASMVVGAYVPPSREAQTIYTTVAETANIEQTGRSTVAIFDVPPHIPVERVLFELNPGDKTNFSRSVTVTATAKAETDRRAFDEVVSGDISRVRMTSGGKEIHEEDLGITAILGSNARSAMTIKVAIENGDDKPLPIHAVKLQMRERRLCFDAPNEPVTMFYGDDKLVAPVYDYSRIFRPEEASAVATLEPEQPNPTYAARADQRSLTERHPELLWVALVAVVLVLGVVAFRSARRVNGPHS